MKKLFLILIILLGVLSIGANYNLLPEIPGTDLADNVLPDQKAQLKERKVITSEESATIDVIEDSLPSVVTIGISRTAGRRPNFFELDPFDPFSPFEQMPDREETIEQNIGSGFVLSKNGLIITNRHVVERTEATYNVVTNDGQSYDVENISRDPLNDLAILKIDASNLKPITLGDSTNLKLGQHVIAIGTPLGEFQNTVTTGIISGLGRGITAGSPFEGYVERLDNVIQTDAAINPGNSGGPLINSSGEVIGVNTAVSAGSENIGFAIPINVVKDLVDNFDARSGTITRPFLGVQYQMISRETAVMNDLPEGAYIIDVVEGSPAQRAGIQPDDIITEFDGKRLRENDEQTLQKLISSKDVGDRIRIKIWRDGRTLQRTITLSTFE